MFLLDTIMSGREPLDVVLIKKLHGTISRLRIRYGSLFVRLPATSIDLTGSLLRSNLCRFTADTPLFYKICYEGAIQTGHSSNIALALSLLD